MLKQLASTSRVRIVQPTMRKPVRLNTPKNENNKKRKDRFNDGSLATSNLTKAEVGKFLDKMLSEVQKFAEDRYSTTYISKK